MHLFNTCCPSLPHTRIDPVIAWDYCKHKFENRNPAYSPLIFYVSLRFKTEAVLTWPKSMVKLTSLYFMLRDRGGLCHQFSVPSIAYSGGWFLSGRVGSQWSHTCEIAETNIGEIQYISASDIPIYKHCRISGLPMRNPNNKRNYKRHYSISKSELSWPFLSSPSLVHSLRSFLFPLYSHHVWCYTHPKHTSTVSQNPSVFHQWVINLTRKPYRLRRFLLPRWCFLPTNHHIMYVSKE